MKTAKKFTLFSVTDATITNGWHLLKAWKVWLIYALILAFLSAISGNWSHTCKDSLYLSWWCSSVSSVYAGYARIAIFILLSTFLCFAFCYDISQKNAGFSSIFSFSREKLKFMGFSFVFCGLFFASLAIACWIVFRKANPNWLIEFALFLAAFSLSALAILILRTSAALGLFLKKGRLPCFKNLFNLTHGKFYVVLITFCLITYVVNMLQMRILGFLEILNIDHPGFITAVSSEILGSIIKFMALAAYVAYFSALAECLVPAEFKIEEQPANDVAPAAKTVRKKAPAKPAKSSKTKAKSGKKSK